MTKTPAPETEDKPPALPAMMIIEILKEIADSEPLISERLRRKKDIETLLAREDITTVLDLEREVGQEVFVYAVKLIKTAIGTRIAEIVDNYDQMGELGVLKDNLINGIDEIKPVDPYAQEQG